MLLPSSSHRLLSQNRNIMSAGQVACRVVVAYDTDLFARHVQNVLEVPGALVTAFSGTDEGLARSIRGSPPDAIVMEDGALTSENLQAVYDMAVASPSMAVLCVRVDRTGRIPVYTPTLVAQGRGRVVAAIQRHLRAHLVKVYEGLAGRNGALKPRWDLTGGCHGRASGEGERAAGIWRGVRAHIFGNTGDGGSCQADETNSLPGSSRIG